MPFILLSCSKNVYVICDSKMIKEPYYIDVKERRASNMITRFHKKNIKPPVYRDGQMELYFEHIDSTIRFRPNEIKQLR